ncbi:transcriptional regulator, partial [Salmonella enterica subsp. enterica serovar Typhimurium]
MACEYIVIDISSFNSELVFLVIRFNFKDYLQFLNKVLSHLPVWQRNADPFLTANCLTPDIFRVAARNSAVEAPDE